MVLHRTAMDSLWLLGIVPLSVCIIWLPCTPHLALPVKSVVSVSGVSEFSLLCQQGCCCFFHSSSGLTHSALALKVGRRSPPVVQLPVCGLGLRHPKYQQYWNVGYRSCIRQLPLSKGLFIYLCIYFCGEKENVDLLCWRQKWSFCLSLPRLGL